MTRFCAFILVALATGGAAFTVPALRAALGHRRAAISMKDFFDDEKDTVTQAPWSSLQADGYDKKKFRSAAEAAGFSETGGDLANEGLIIYIAAVPFVLGALYFIFGNIDGPYSTGGNF